jgi:hypothetical protein
MTRVKQKKKPKIKVNGQTTTTAGSQAVYGDVVQPTTIVQGLIPDDGQIVLGCVHGRRVGQPCPHCMGINNLKPIEGGESGVVYFDKLYVNGKEVKQTVATDPLEQALIDAGEEMANKYDKEILEDLRRATKKR